ncbi:MAG: hypothetical protein R3F14_08740 [Polyangiaceae bacterium]
MRRLLLFVGCIAGLNLAIVVGSPGCGSTVIEIKPGDGGGGEGGSTTTDGGADPGDGGVDTKDALPDYVDPGCPDGPPPPDPQLECDAFNQNNGDCLPGDGCYIFVQYPDDPCEQEIYGTYCAPAGPQQQGDPCGGGPDCGAGLVCVITGFGTQCVQLCPLSGNSGCPDGLTCEAIDVEGFGGCF